jgi:hypothetical protein
MALPRSPSDDRSLNPAGEDKVTVEAPLPPRSIGSEPSRLEPAAAPPGRAVSADDELPCSRS